MDILSIYKENPNINITISVGDLVKAGHEIVAETVRSLEQMITDSNAETYPSVGKVSEMLQVSKPTLWRWEKTGYLIPVRIGGKVRYKMSDVKQILEERG